jgi:hypothetical protein
LYRSSSADRLCETVVVFPNDGGGWRAGKISAPADIFIANNEKIYLNQNAKQMLKLLAAEA